MILLRVGSFLALWATVVVLGARAYIASVNASTLDTRLTWALPLIAAALLLGHLLASAAARRRPASWRRLELTDHGLCLVVAALCTTAMSHVPVDSTITAMRQQVPPVLGFVYPLMAGLAPLLLRRRDQGHEPVLWFAAASLPLSGAMLLLDGPTALCLATLALLEQLTRGPGRVPRSPLLLVPLGVVGLLAAATFFGRNPFHASPSLAWTLAGTLLMLAVASRPRDPASLRRLLCAPVLAAVAIAVCGGVLKAFLAMNIEVLPALHTRLTLFRQHPNFLAPFFAFNALVALGLALSDKHQRIRYLAFSLLLAVATWGTDSRSGQALLVIGLLGMVLLPWLHRVVARFHRRALSAAALALAVVLAAGLWGLTTDRGQQLAATSLDRFEKSLDYRLDAWRNAALIIEGQPWLGVGPHTFISAHRFEPGSRFFNEPTSPHPHNVLLYVAQSAGLPALVLFVIWALMLLRALWRSPPPGNEPSLAPRLRDALLAALVALALANQLDVGLSLDTVVPEPLFLLTGILLAAGLRSGAPPIRLGFGMLWLLGIGVVFVPLGLDGVAARRHLEHARLHAFHSTQAVGGHSTMAAAITEAERALELDPDLENAYELLTRWYESSEAGFPAAHALLKRMSNRAPRYGSARSLLGHLYMRAMMFPEAANALAQALGDEHGSIHQNRDRADTVKALCRVGRRVEALEQLVQALSLDVGVVDALPWIKEESSGSRLLDVKGLESQTPIRLLEAVDILVGQRIQTHEAGGLVGRKNWLDTYAALRRAGASDRAMALLDYFEAKVPLVERHTISHERGRLFMEQGDAAQALKLFEQTLEMTGNTFYQAEVLRARQQLGLESDEPLAAPGQDAGLEQLVEILDQPWVFEHKLEVMAEILAEAGEPRAAAKMLQRSMLFVDDLLLRAQRWEEIGDLFLAAGQYHASLKAYAEALQHLSAKPYPLALLQTSLDQSQPARIGRSMAAAWRAQGHPPTGVVAAAWSLKDFFSHRTSWSLFRAAVFSEAGQMDALLREAQLQLMVNPDSLLAGWSEVDALEGLGRHHEMATTMRALSEHFFDVSPTSLDRLYAQAVADGQSRMEDPDAWRTVATIELLRGRYSEAASLFAAARNLLGRDQARLFAELAGLQARAELLTGAPEALETARTLLSEASAAAPGCVSLRRRLEALP